MDSEAIMNMAWERYDKDPLFHARVYHAGMIVKAEIEATGTTWSRALDGALTASAAVALIMTEIHDPITGEFNGVAGTQGSDHGDRQRGDGPGSEDTDELDGP